MFQEHVKGAIHGYHDSRYTIKDPSLPHRAFKKFPYGVQDTEPDVP